MPALSSDALCVATHYFKMGEPGKSTLVIENWRWIPTTRGLAALTELVAAGILSMKPFNRLGGVRYTYEKEFKPVSNAFIEEHGGFKLVERRWKKPLTNVNNSSVRNRTNQIS